VNLLPAAGPLLVALVGLLNFVAGRKGPRERLKADLNLAALLPEESAGRRVLLAKAEEAIPKIIKDETELTRDTSGIILASLFLGGAIAVALTIAASNSAWWGLVATLAIFGVVGISQDAVPRRRDARGRPLKE
jgi:hypothetical protein